MKKGQVTTFIILGIVIIIIVAGALYFRNIIFKSEFQKELEKSRLVPEQIKPIKTFIDGCLEEVSKEAVSIVGMQGGYVKVKDDFMIPGQLSNTLILNKGSNSKVAYWSYKATNGILKNEVPSLKEISENIGVYIKENFDKCLNELDIFNDDGFKITKGPIENVKVDVLDENVNIIVYKNIYIEKGGIKFNLDKQLIKVDVALGNLYKIARKILEKENKDNFLEEKTIDMLVVYDELPYSGTDFDCSNKIWLKENVINDLKKIVSNNLNYIRVKGTNYNDKDGYFEVEALENTYDANVNFVYSRNWPMEVEISPSDNGVLMGDDIIQEMPGGVGGFLRSLFCLTDYHFVYDIRYPVLVIVGDNRGNVFQYGMQVIIDNNEPKQILSEPIDISMDNICENADIDVRVDTFSVKNDDSLIPLSNVDVAFKCITANCKIGRSKNGYLEAKFPGCVNGLLTGKKDGYKDASVYLSTNQMVETSLVLEPMYEKNVDVKLIEKNGKIRSPYESEQVIIDVNSEEYSTMLVYPDMNTIRLATGVYGVKAYVIGSSSFDITISGKTIEKCVDVPKGWMGMFGVTEEKCVQQEIPDMKVSNVVKGGGSFEWDVNREELDNSRSVIFYVIVDEIPSNYDELNQIYNNLEENSYNNLFRYPEFR